MKVTQIQMDIVWGDVNANCTEASRLIDSCPGSDLYVLPEMFSTGFTPNPEHLGDEGQVTLRWMQQKADSIGAAICGSVAIRLPEEGCYNRFYFVRPHDRVVYYDKHHLFTMGKEHLHYQAGNERVIVPWRGVRFLLQVCYDLRFPAFARNHGRDEGFYDCILYVASWPSPRIDAYCALLRARAIENQCYVLGTNRVGHDRGGAYPGNTEAIDPYGRLVGTCPDRRVGLVTTEIDMASLLRFREHFPVLLDADK